MNNLVSLLCKQYNGMSGLARYVSALTTGFDQIGQPYQIMYPRVPQRKPLGFDGGAFFGTFPILTTSVPQKTPIHLTSQEMGTWLFLHRWSKSIVTVHDILPYLLRHSEQFSEGGHLIERLFYRLALRGLRHATHIVTDSGYTKRTLIEQLNLADERISVVPLGVDHKQFRPIMPPSQFYQKFNLPTDKRIVLYVGSDAPRKNFKQLLAAFHLAQQQIPDLILVKVGSFTNLTRQRAVEQEIERLGLTQNVCVLMDVSAENLTYFYNAASVFVFPSYYEGFGLPPLEAMACGTPVICANTTSLPEVVGNAALLIDPDQPMTIMLALSEVLTNPDRAKQLSEKGKRHAKTFRWINTAKQTAWHYQCLF